MTHFSNPSSMSRSLLENLFSIFSDVPQFGHFNVWDAGSNTMFPPHEGHFMLSEAICFEFSSTSSFSISLSIFQNAPWFNRPAKTPANKQLTYISDIHQQMDSTKDRFKLLKLLSTFRAEFCSWSCLCSTIRTEFILWSFNLLSTFRAELCSAWNHCSTRTLRATS